MAVATQIGSLPSLSLTRAIFRLLARLFARDLRRSSKLQTFEIPEGMVAL